MRVDSSKSDHLKLFQYCEASKIPRGPPILRQVRSQLNAYLRVFLGPRKARERTMAWWDGHGGLRGPQGCEAWSGSPAGGRLLASCTSAATAAET